MTGFEIIGVVLGSIPLLISALKHISRGISIILDIWNYEIVFDVLCASFDSALAIYKHSCEELLIPLMLPDNHLRKLLDVDGNVWEDAELGKRLCDQLGYACEPYKSSVVKLNEKINKFSKKLKLGNDMRAPCIAQSDTVDRDVRKKFKRFWTKISFGFNSDKYGKLLDGIRSDIDQISTLTSGAIKLKPLRDEWKCVANSSYWICVRNNAQRLFEILSSRWSCACPCQYPHHANLQLDMRDEYGTEDVKIQFGFVFSFGEDATVAASLPWNWRDFKIRSLQTPRIPETIIASTQPSTRGAPGFSAVPPIVLIPPPPSSNPTENPEPIDDLCKILGSTIQTNGCLGFLDDQSWQHHIYPVTRSSFESEVKKAQSLEEILYRARVDIRDKCSLALTLAFAVLQLHNTPWLSENWGMKDIYCINSTGTLLVDQLYVSKGFAPIPSSQKSTQSKSCPVIRNEVVFALGVALLELSYGKPILQFMTPNDLDNRENETIYTKFLIASRLAKEIYQYEPRNYADAVNRCVSCSFDIFHACSLDVDEFRKKFYQGVILPLQQNYKHVTETSP